MATVFVQSTLHADVATVWAVVGTMAGVNAELGPWIRMSVPRALRGMRIEDAPIDRVAFASWISVARIPIDRHSVRFRRVTPGQGFFEDSRSWLQTRWVHERTLTAAKHGYCTLSDRVSFQPRVGALEPVVGRIVQIVFKHRHAVLKRRFGAT